MSSRFDPVAYRAARLYPDPEQRRVVEDIVDNLSNAENLTLWKDGIVKPNFQSPTDAYSHFHGFRQLMVDRAICEMKEHNDPFIGNHIEELLSPSRVEKFIQSLEAIREGISSDPGPNAQTLRKHEALHFVHSCLTQLRPKTTHYSAPYA